MIRAICSRIRSILMRRAWAWSWWLSLFVHSMIVSGFVLYWLNRIELPKPVASESLQIDGGFTQRSAMDNQPLLVEQTSERIDRARVLRDIRQEMKQAQERGEEDNFERLRQLSADLRRNSTTKTVDEMSEFLGGVFGKRATEPDAKKATEEFDVSTAQMHDITKLTDEQGVVRYVIVMIDAMGVTREVDVDAENGQRLYKTMRLIKSNPLLEKVYRNILMGILDQVLKEQ